jgi:1-deoxy-D-xylulose-5-phosphate reductoisomerase
MKQVAILGATGSIGQNTLKVIHHLSDRFEAFALSAHSAVDQLAEQVAAFRPKVVALTDIARVDEFARECRKRGITPPEIVTGDAGLRSISSAAEVDVVVSGIVGAAGLSPTYAAVASGKTVALANKEAMVLAGQLLSATAMATGGRIIPIDSEHSALDQCLRSGTHEEVKRLILTASGGPFRNTPAGRFATVTPEEALNHPTWRMGKRITVDSATMMNKGLEVIEARWLFNVPPERVDIVVHPQSIVHSMVEFTDGSIIAQLGVTDMRQPIQYALTYPERLASSVVHLDWTAAMRLDFMPPEPKKFPCIGLAYRAAEMGGTAPAVLNAADEVAVEAFLQKRIGFTDIPEVIRMSLDSHEPVAVNSVDIVLKADDWARRTATEIVQSKELA